MDLDAIRTAEAMGALERVIPESLDGLGSEVKARFDNAMLNVAVNRILLEEGALKTSALLIRLADAIASNHLPTEDSPIELTKLDG